MTHADTISIARLLALLDEGGTSEASSEPEARRLLGGLSRDEEVPVGWTDTEIFRQTFRRRAARTGAEPTVVVLAQTFESMDAPEVASLGVSVEGRMVYLWLDVELTSIIGCFVGTDRRTDPA